MPGKSLQSSGNLQIDTALYQPAVTFPTLAANASGSNTLTVPGVLPNDLISWNMQAPPAHLVLDNVYVSAPNVLTLLWSSDATGISTATVPVIFGVSRIDGANLGLSAFPAALV